MHVAAGDAERRVVVADGLLVRALQEAVDLAVGVYVLTGKPRLTPPWLGSSQREVTALPRV